MTFFLVGRKQCDTLRFWIYIVGSSLEARHYSYTLTVANNAGDKQYNHKGQVFTLDSYEIATGLDSLFSLLRIAYFFDRIPPLGNSDQDSIPKHYFFLSLLDDRFVGALLC